MAPSVNTGSGRQEVRGFGLVLTRREGEEVVIGDPNDPLGVVRITEIRGEKVRIAFGFRREIEIHRREVADAILREDEGGEDDFEEEPDSGG